MTAPVCSAHPQPEGWQFRPLSSPHSRAGSGIPAEGYARGGGDVGSVLGVLLRRPGPARPGPARGALPAPNPLPPPLAPRAGPLWPQIFPQAKLILTGLYESLPTFSPTVGVGKAGAIFQDPSHCYF